MSHHAANVVAPSTSEPTHIVGVSDKSAYGTVNRFFFTVFFLFFIALGVGLVWLVSKICDLRQLLFG
jgi:hypothetical protein